jgi:beta-lactamase class C
MLTAARDAAAQLVVAGHLPGLVVAVAHGGEAPELFAIGQDAAGRALAADTLFPVASITKLATALAVLRLVDQGALALEDELATLLPDAAAALPGVTLRSLLCHASGLALDVAAGAAPYAAQRDWSRLAEACRRTALEAPPWTRVQYSNVGYGLLALVVEAATSQPFPAALRELVLTPLGVSGFLGEEPPHPPALLADVRGRHQGTAIEPFNSRFYRSLALPWAGLVADAAGALALVRAFFGMPHGFLSEPLRAAASANQTGDLPGGFIDPLRWERCPWGLGPDILGEKTPHWAPHEAGAASFGHSGASGALTWVAPEHKIAWAILGARTADGGWLLRRSKALSTALLKR